MANKTFVLTFVEIKKRVIFKVLLNCKRVSRSQHRRRRLQQVRKVVTANEGVAVRQSWRDIWDTLTRESLGWKIAQKAKD